MDEQANQSQTKDKTNSENANSELDTIKRRALEALVPLMHDMQEVDTERKFDLCISAMRFTDNKELAAVALEAALAIESNGTKAEALVTLINEINYLQQS